jgi:hypothetical protein
MPRSYGHTRALSQSVFFASPDHQRRPWLSIFTAKTKRPEIPIPGRSIVFAQPRKLNNPYAPKPNALLGLSQRILVREALEILSLPLIAPTVLSGNLSMASLCG